MKNSEIGGFFELELAEKEEYHSSAIRLNKARSAIYYILKAKQVKKVFLPYYLCSCILEPIEMLNIDYEFYNIDQKFLPIFEKKIEAHECFFYINYFGLFSENVKKIISKMNNVIIDNTQAFFDYPYEGVDTIYSPRKFFGVPDGSYLYTDKKWNEQLESDYSYKRLDHLVKRIDISANQSYELFQKNEEALSKVLPRKMSNLTRRILKSIDYEYIKKRRNENFLYLHNELKKSNQLNLDLNKLNGPMVYPWLVELEKVKQILIQNNIFVATYWKEVLHNTEADWFEYKLGSKLVPLPIDQRYNQSHMESILKVIKEAYDI